MSLTLLILSQILPIIPPIIYYYISICKCISFNSILISKISAFMINYNLSVILSLSTNIHKKIFYIPTHNFIHPTFTHSLSLWTIIHTISHHITLQRIITLNLTLHPYSHPTIISGYTILFLLLSLYILITIKKKLYHIFQLLHFIITSIILSLTIYHGSLCFIKLNHTCPPHTTWIWLLPPTILYSITTLLKYTSYTPIHSTLRIPDNITQINLKLPPSYIGKYIYLCIPHINILEWHPFTISHYNHSNHTCSIYVKHTGDWTSKLQHLNHNIKSSLIHGPFISLPTINYHKPNIFISTGTGITSFSHLLIHQQQHTHSNIKFIIITQNPTNIQWLLNILPKHNSHLVQFFFTQYHSTPHSHLQHLNYYNYKPNFKQLLLKLYLETPHPPINLFFSGNKNTSKLITKICSKHPYYKLYTI